MSPVFSRGNTFDIVECAAIARSAARFDRRREQRYRLALIGCVSVI
ncbi:hypothetical protein ACVBGC_00420 [Burkholderia stagnalis]